MQRVGSEYVVILYDPELRRAFAQHRQSQTMHRRHLPPEKRSRRLFMYSASRLWGHHRP